MEADARRVGQYSEGEKIDSATDLAGRLLTTVYMGTINSSKETQERAAALAKQVHLSSSKQISGRISGPCNAMLFLPERTNFREQYQHCSLLCRLALITWMSELTQLWMPWPSSLQSSLAAPPDSG